MRLQDRCVWISITNVERLPYGHWSMDLVLDSSWGAAKRKLGTQTETNNRTGYVSYLKSQATFIIIIQYMLWERGHWDSSHMAIFCVFIVILKPIGQFCCAPLSAALFCVFLSSYTDVKADWCSQWTSLYSWWHCYIALLLCCSVHRLCLVPWLLTCIHMQKTQAQRSPFKDTPTFCLCQGSKQHTAVGYISIVLIPK